MSPTDPPAPVEAKVKWAAAGSYLASVGLLAALQALQADESLIEPLPDLLEAPVAALIPGLLAFVAGYRARHTPRRTPPPDRTLRPAYGDHDAPGSAQPTDRVRDDDG